MNDSGGKAPGRGGCAQLTPDLVADYARGALAEVAAWSVEGHLPGCAACQRVLTRELDHARLDRNRSVLLTRLALPAAGPAERAVTWCGVPAYVWRLLSVTPSLRRSWLAGVALVLAAAFGAAWLAALTGSAYPAGAGAAGGPGGPLAGSWPALPAGLLPFLILAPLLPLAGVAAAFHSRLDPSADLATAAPLSGIQLFCIRAVAVIAAALVPTMLVALALPGSQWLPLLVVLPALAVSAAALAASTLTEPLTAAIGAGAGWTAVAFGLTLRIGSPADAYGGPAQAAWLAVLIGAGCLLAARRRRLELGWSR